MCPIYLYAFDNYIVKAYGTWVYVYESWFMCLLPLTYIRLNREILLNND